VTYQEDKLLNYKPTDYDLSILDSCNNELACKGYAAKAQLQWHLHNAGWPTDGLCQV